MLMKERQSREKTSGHVTDVKIWILNPDSCRHFHFYAPLVKTAIDILVESFIRFVDTLLQSWNSFSFILRITYAILFSFQILLSIWKLFLTYHISKGLKYSLTHFDWLKKSSVEALLFHQWNTWRFLYINWEIYNQLLNLLFIFAQKYLRGGFRIKIRLWHDEWLNKTFPASISSSESLIYTFF